VDQVLPDLELLDKVMRGMGGLIQLHIRLVVVVALVQQLQAEMAQLDQVHRLAGLLFIMLAVELAA